MIIKRKRSEDPRATATESVVPKILEYRTKAELESFVYSVQYNELEFYLFQIHTVLLSIYYRFPFLLDSDPQPLSR